MVRSLVLDNGGGCFVSSVHFARARVFSNIDSRPQYSIDRLGHGGRNALPTLAYSTRFLPGQDGTHGLDVRQFMISLMIMN